MISKYLGQAASWFKAKKLKSIRTEFESQCKCLLLIIDRTRSLLNKLNIKTDDNYIEEYLVNALSNGQHAFPSKETAREFLSAIKLMFNDSYKEHKLILWDISSNPWKAIPKTLDFQAKNILYAYRRLDNPFRESVWEMLSRNRVAVS